MATLLSTAPEAPRRYETFLRNAPPTDPGKKMDALIFISATDCNPNGDPDDDNRPRQDQEVGNGLISGVSVKRHIRDTMSILMGNEPGYALYMSRKSILDHKLLAIHDQLGITSKKKPKKAAAEASEDDNEPQMIDAESEKKARDLACKMYIDTRWFGAVMSSKMANCGQLRGPLQIGWGRSIDPVQVVGDSLTRGDLQTDREAQDNSTRQTFGGRPRVAFGLYRSEVYFTPAFAQATGIEPKDIDLFWECMVRMHEYTRSSARDGIAVEQVVIFEHDGPLGRAPAHKLLRMVNVKRVDETKPARHVDDYSFPTQEEIQNKIQAAGYKGVKVHFLL